MEHIFDLMTVWMAFLFAPFRFTFTDPQDYICIGSIVIILGLLAGRHFKRPYPKKWIKCVSIVTYALTILTPLIMLSYLYPLAFHLKSVIGHWPQHMISDTGQLMQTDPTFRKLFTTCQNLSAFEGWGLWVWLGLMLHLGQNLSNKKVLWHIAIFVIVWLAAVYEPGGRLAWWATQPGALPQWIERINPG